MVTVKSIYELGSEGTAWSPKRRRLSIMGPKSMDDFFGGDDIDCEYDLFYDLEKTLSGKSKTKKVNDVRVRADGRVFLNFVVIDADRFAGPTEYEMEVNYNNCPWISVTTVGRNGEPTATYNIEIGEYDTSIYELVRPTSNTVRKTITIRASEPYSMFIETNPGA